MDTILVVLLALAILLLASIYALRRIGEIGEDVEIEAPDYETYRRETYDRWQDNRVRVPHAEDC